MERRESHIGAPSRWDIHLGADGKIALHSKNNAPCGLYHTVVKPDLKEVDWSRVKDIETMSVEMYPSLNERLYLCSVMGRNVNPELEIYLGRPIAEAYGTYVKILCGDKIPDYC